MKKVKYAFVAMYVTFLGYSVFSGAQAYTPDHDPRGFTEGNADLVTGRT
jgi:hypothetical protein